MPLWALGANQIISIGASSCVGGTFTVQRTFFECGQRFSFARATVSRGRFLLVAAVGMFSCLAPVRAQTKRVYIAPDDHTDYFWSADESAYRQAFLSTLDYYLNLADSTANNDPAYQSRWNCDGSLWMWTYERNRSDAQFQRLIERIRDGHITVPLNGLCVCLGGAPAEAVLRGMYYPGHVERKHNLRFRLAYCMENQTLSYGLISLWTGSGVHFSWKGTCSCDSRTPSPWDREHDIYRAVGPDGTALLMKWNSQLDGNQGMGGYAEAYDPGATVEYVTTDAASNGFLDRYPYDVIGCFGKGWDNFETMTDEFISTAMDKTDSTRQVIVSNEVDFFKDFADTYEVSSLPAVACTFGNEWELYSAGMAEETARTKRAVEKLRGAEAMSAVVSVFNPTFMDGRDTARDQAWVDLGIFYEHDFGMVNAPTGSAGRTKRIAWQKRITGEIEDYVDKLHEDAATALADLIPAPATADRFFVFNPLGWTRTDFADFAYNGSASVHVIDVATQDETPSQIVTLNGQTYLRILAADIPSVGYKVFEIQSGDGQNYSSAATVSGSGSTRVLENDNYAVTIGENGAITSLIDKTRGNREFAQDFDGRVVNDLGASSGTLTTENFGRVSVTVKAVASAPVAHTTRITLYRDSDRIDIQNEITENFSDVQTYGFCFYLDNPDIHHEEVGGILRARFLDDGGDYATRNARYDWLTLNHFVDMSDAGNEGVTISNADCSFFQMGLSDPGYLDTERPVVAVLAGGNVANGDEGIPDQAGNSHFLHRFALQTHNTYDPTAAMKMAMEHQNPMICGQVTGASAQLPGESFSALSNSNSSVLLWALKPAEEGANRGLIARLWNVSNAAQTSNVQLSPYEIIGAKQTSHIETDEGDEAFDSTGINPSFSGQQIRTFRLAPANCDDTDDDGTVDCVDGCPDDPGKTEPEPCNCGVPIEDNDNNGVVDCVENPPGTNPLPGLQECCGGGAATATPLLLIGWLALRRRERRRR